MNDFIFTNRTKIYFGKDQLQHLGEEVARFGKKVLLAYGGGSIKRFGERVMGVDPSLEPMEGAKAAIAALEEFFFGTLGLKSRLSDLGIDDTHFATMAKKACGEKGTLDSFTTLTPADVEAIFRMCL